VRVTAGRTVDFNGTFSDPGVNDRLWGWTWNLSPAVNHSGAVPDQVPVPDSHRFCKAGSFSAQFTVVDKDGGSGTDAVAVTVDAIPVQIDINPSTINLNENGHAMVTVRAYSSPDLNVTTLNAASIVLTNGSGKGTTIARTGGGLLQWNADGDLNGDGLLDVEMKFRRDELIKNDDLQMNTTKLMLKGSIDESLSAAGECGDVLGSADVRVKVKAKNGSAASPLNSDETP
jgi:hypothetical protein